MNLRKYIPAIVLFLLVVIMAVTNPGETHFKSYMQKQLLQHKFSQSDIDNKLTMSQTFDYIIFSGYSFQITDAGVPVQGKYLGIFGLFFSISGYTPDQSE